jgi:hypothetical protein
MKEKETSIALRQTILNKISHIQCVDYLHKKILDLARSEQGFVFKVNL